MRTRLLGLMFLVLAVLLASGCGGASSSTGLRTSGNDVKGAMNVRLVDSPTSDFTEINLDIQQVQIHQSAAAGESGWITLGSPNKIVNLLTLQGGVVETLVSGASLPVGTYQQLRLVLGSRNSVTLKGGTTANLTVPSGMQTGVKIPGSFTVAPGTTADIFIDFDAAHSIHIHQAGPSQTYMLRPVVQGCDKAVTGSISGTLAGVGGVGLAGVQVLAEQVDGSGNVRIVRSVTTSPSGAYTLDLLPLGGRYFVVSMPVVGTTAYTAQASGEIVLGTTTPVQVFSATFTPALGTGGLSGTITPPATSAQSDTLFVLQSFSSGTGPHWLAVTSAAVTGATPESYLVTGLPAGTYNAQALRSTLNADGSSTLTRTVLGTPVAVTTGAAATQNLGF